jgi:hypothetical protein
MTEQQLSAVKQALEALECIPTSGSMLGTYAEQKRIEAITALQSIISQDALYKMAEDAVTIGLSYNDWPKIGCVNHDCDQCKAVPHFDHTAAASAALREAQNRSYQIAKAAQPAPVQEPVCHICNGTGEMDSGGTQPWGEAINIPCECTAPPAPQPVPVKTYHDGKPWPVAPKPWVGLTSDEMLEALTSVDPETKRLPVGFSRFACAIEAKLKEKNL